MEALDYQSLLTNGKLRPDRIEDLLVEVVSGKYLFSVGEEVFASRVPTPTEADTARLLYVRDLNQNLAGGMMSREETEKVALANGTFDVRERTEREALTRLLERLNKSRDQCPDPQQRLKLTVDAQKAHKRLAEINTAEEVVLRHCAESRAEETRNAFLVYSCTMTGEFLQDPLWASWDEFQFCTDQQLLLEAQRAQLRVLLGLPVNIIRALARTPQWRERWRAAKDARTTVFDGSGSSWDRNKISLVSWSDFFDQVLNHPDCPDERLIHDDAGLDAWVNKQVAKAKSEKSKRNQSAGPPVTYVDGSGRRRQMHNVSRSTTQVNQGYRIRGSQEE